MIGYRIDLIPKTFEGEEVLENANETQIAIGKLFWRDPFWGDCQLVKKIHTILVPPEGLLTHFVSSHFERKQNIDLSSGITFNNYLERFGLNIMPELEHSSQHMADQAINSIPKYGEQTRAFRIKHGLTITFSAMYLYALRTFVNRQIIHHEEVVINHLYLHGFSLRHEVIYLNKDGGYIGELPKTMPESQMERLILQLS